MALTITQEVSLFQILEVPYYTGYYQTDGMGAVVASTNIPSSNAASAKTTILAFVTANIVGQSVEAELKTLLDDWATVGTTPAKMEGGSVGSITGLTYDYDKKRDHIERRVKFLVPFYKYHEVAAKQSGGGAGFEVLH